MEYGTGHIISFIPRPSQQFQDYNNKTLDLRLLQNLARPPVSQCASTPSCTLVQTAQSPPRRIFSTPSPLGFLSALDRCECDGQNWSAKRPRCSLPNLACSIARTVNVPCPGWREAAARQVSFHRHRFLLPIRRSKKPYHGCQ